MKPAPMAARIAELERENADLRARLAARPSARCRLWAGEAHATRTGRRAASTVAYHVDGRVRCYPVFRAEFSAFDVDCLDAPEWMARGSVRFSHNDDSGGGGVAFASDQFR